MFIKQEREEIEGEGREEQQEENRSVRGGITPTPSNSAGQLAVSPKRNEDMKDSTT